MSSRFPFVYPCKDMISDTVITCLNDLFSMFGMPAYVHSDRGPSFMSEELKTYLHSKGIATSNTTKYNPAGNGQCERYNGAIWKSIRLSLYSKNLPVTCWETVLPDVLHSHRSLLNTSTNCSPHERMFLHSRRSSSGISIPTWLTKSKTALVKRHVRTSKHDPLVDEVDILEVNPCYVRVKYPSGREDNVSLKHVAPAPQINTDCENVVVDLDNAPSDVASENAPQSPDFNPHQFATQNVITNNADKSNDYSDIISSSDDEDFIGFRRSARIREKSQVNYKE